jgi:hypothetical protein
LILFRLIFLAITGFFFLAVTATALAGFLVLSGAPHPCVDRSVSPAPPPNEALQANWNDVIQRVDDGEAVALSVTEEQATSLAQGHLEGKNVPVENLQVYFCPDGTTEALGKVKVAGLGSDVLVKGRVDIDRAQPRVEIDSLEAGNLPSFVAERLLDLIWDGEAARTIPLDISILSMDVHDGEAIVVVAPGA